MSRGNSTFVLSIYVSPDSGQQQSLSWHWSIWSSMTTRRQRRQASTPSDSTQARPEKDQRGRSPLPKSPATKGLKVNGNSAGSFPALQAEATPSVTWTSVCGQTGTSLPLPIGIGFDPALTNQRAGSHSWPSRTAPNGNGNQVCPAGHLGRRQWRRPHRKRRRCRMECGDRNIILSASLHYPEGTPQRSRLVDATTLLHVAFCRKMHLWLASR